MWSEENVLEEDRHRVLSEKLKVENPYLVEGICDKHSS